jgi:hypothetical protein
MSSIHKFHRRTNVISGNTPTLPFTVAAISTDPYLSNVALLVTANGKSAGTSTYTDLSSSPKTITNVGTTVVDTNIVKNGSGSMVFSSTSTGDGNLLTIPSMTIPQIFTIELWARPNSSKTHNDGVISLGSGFSTLGIAYGDNNGNNFTLRGAVSGGTGAAYPINTWYHLAITRDTNNMLRFYVNGILQYSATDSRTYPSAEFIIGSYGNPVSYAFGGNIDDVRITYNVARYVSNFTPPTNAFTTPVVAGAPWTYSLAGGSNINITSAQLTSWGMPNGTTNITITNTADIRSTSITTPALTFAADLTGKTISFINSVNCFVAGRGGGENQAGGTAIKTLVPVSITNNGIIGGGGGGGGGQAGGGGWGGGTMAQQSGNATGGSGGGAGGGAGGLKGTSASSGTNGTAGAASLLGAGGNAGIAGDGTAGAPGGAQLGGGGGFRYSGATTGGNGGSLGNAGTAATGTWISGGGGSAGAAGGNGNDGGTTVVGGAAGKALEGKSFVNSGAGLSSPATISGAITQGTFYGAQV